MRILMMLIPEPAANGDGSAIVRLDRSAGPYYTFTDAGIEVVLASPLGGPPRMESSGATDELEYFLQRLGSDQVAMDGFSDTLRFDQVCTVDFEAAFCIGVPDAIWRPEHAGSAGALIARFLDAGKPVAVIPSCLDLTPKGTGRGQLFVGDVSESSLPLAEALMGAIGHSLKNQGSEP